MPNPLTWQIELTWQLGIIVGVAFLLGGLLSYVATQSRANKQQRKLETATHQLEREFSHQQEQFQNELHHLDKELATERVQYQQKLETLNEARRQLAENFSLLSQQALKANNESFLQLAQSHLGQFEERAKATFTQKEQAIESLIKPVSEALLKTEKQISEIERNRRESFGNLTAQLKFLAESNQGLRSETENLVQALRRPEVRGQWGELTLKRLAELAGMVNHCDFFEQERRETNDDKNIRPDMIVRMPERRELIVDAKTPLDAYISAVQSTNANDRDKHLARHARKVRDRMKELAGKAYWAQFDRAPDFVILFIPGEQFLSTALEYDHKLLEDAFDHRVILATPTTLVALLRAVAYGWQQIAMSENTEHIRQLAQDLYKRLASFSEHLQKMGKSLDNSVSHFNRAVGSLERQVLPGARKFTEMGISAKQEIPVINNIDKKTRNPIEANESQPTEQPNSE